MRYDVFVSFESKDAQGTAVCPLTDVEPVNSLTANTKDAVKKIPFFGKRLTIKLKRYTFSIFVDVQQICHRTKDQRSQVSQYQHIVLIVVIFLLQIHQP